MRWNNLDSLKEEKKNPTMNNSISSLSLSSVLVDPWTTSASNNVRVATKYMTDNPRQ